MSKAHLSNVTHTRYEFISEMIPETSKAIIDSQSIKGEADGTGNSRL